MTAATPTSSRAGHWWGETWRAGSASLLGLLTLAAVSTAKVSGYEDGSPWYAVEFVGGVTALVLLFFRRRHPLPIALAACALSAVALTATAPAAICFISVATRRRTRPIVAVSIAWVGSAVCYEFAHPNPSNTVGDRISSAVITLLTIAFCVAVGLAVGSRRELLASLRHQVAIAGEQQRSRVEQARLAERAAIAREMHDVLAHRISLVAMHAGALAYRTDLPPDQVRETATIIRDSSRLALTELREVLGVLRDDERAAGIEPPQPNLAAVRRLVAETPAAEGAIDLALDGDLENVPESLSRNAFRIVQEALTNRRKHAYGAPLEVRVRRDDHQLEIRGSNPMTVTDPLPPSGLGLMGLTERVSLAGGTMTYGIDRQRRFTLVARMPITESGDTTDLPGEAR